jgi:diketogulonate reductase-like aldo/keto reductase
MMPRFGLGTWRMGESASGRAAELAALRLGLDLGVKLIDTAEMYGSGGAEEIVGEAIAGRRDDVFVVTKFYPHHAGRAAVPKACEGSLKRLAIETIDLYLLHWLSSVPLEETVGALEKLVAQGKIKRWGVSNLDLDDMERLVAVKDGAHVASNQVLYSLTQRGIEYDLLPWCAKRRIQVMAYSPLDQGAIATHRALHAVARSLAIEPAQLALAWAMRDPNVVAIPKATRAEHVKANVAASNITLDAAALAALDEAFPPPRRKTPLAMA